MALSRSANRDNQNKRGNEFQDSIEMNVYESVEDMDTAPHIYLTTGTAAVTTGAGIGNLKGSTTVATSKRSCRPVCLALFGGIVLGTVISTIAGVVVYHVIDANRQMPQDPHITPGTNVLDDLNQRLDAIQEKQNVSQTDLDRRMERFQERYTSSQTDVNRQLEGLDTKVHTLQERQNVLGQQVAFAVNNPTSVINKVLTFSNVIINVGDSYNQTSGIFKCPVAGTYLFSATLIGIMNRTDTACCWIRMNLSYIASAYSHEGTKDSTTVTVLLHLVVGDLVYFGNCENVNNFSVTMSSTFIGSLIQAD